MKERLRQFIESQHVSIQKFERNCSLSNGLIGKFFAGNSQISSISLQKIHTAYPSLNIDWLVCGRGSMIYSDLGEKTNEDSEFIQILLARVAQLERRQRDRK